MGRNAPRFTRLGGDPDSLCRRAPESDRSSISGKGQRLIVITSRNVHPRTRTDSATFQEFQQMPVALVDAADDIILSRVSVSEQHKASSSSALGTFEFAQVAVRAGAAAAQFGQQPGFKVGRDRMFQTLSFVVHPIPLHAEDLSQHTFDEVMAKRQLARDLASLRSQSDMAVALHLYQPVLFQPAQSHGDSGWRHRQPVRQRSRNHGLAFALGLEDCLEVVLLGDGDHLGRLYDLSMVNWRAGIETRISWFDIICSAP